jgi:hypothetical protein
MVIFFLNNPETKHKESYNTKYKNLTLLKMAVFWDAVTCFRGMYYIHHQGNEEHMFKKVGSDKEAGQTMSKLDEDQCIRGEDRGEVR